MSVMILLIACSVFLAGGFLVAFIIATSRGQYDDLGSPPVRILVEEECRRKNR